MCGIILKISKAGETVNRDILEQYEDQRHRGTQGFGSMFIDDKGAFKLKRATGEVLAVIDLYLNPSNAIIYHHRAPSSSRNKISQTHPILISDGSLKYNYYFMHNGIISNSDERKKAHEELGFKYSTDVETDDYYDKKDTMFNDTECLGTDIARFIEDQVKHIESIGSAAFFMVQVDKETSIIEKIFYGRNEGNPLKLAKTRGEIMLSSEGKGEDVKADLLYSFDPKTEKMKLTSKEMTIPRYIKTIPVLEPYTPVARPIGFSADDDDDFADAKPYNRSQFRDHTYPTDGYAADAVATLEEELETLCDDYTEEAVEPLTEFFENLKKVDDNQMFKVDVTDYLKRIAQSMISAQEECHKAWSTQMVKEMDEDLQTQIDKEEEPAPAKYQLPEKLHVS